MAGWRAHPTIFLDGHLLRGLVEGVDLDLDVPETPPPGDVDRQAVQDVQGVARKHAPPEPDDVPVIVVLGRLDQYNAEFLKGRSWQWLGY